MDSQETRFRNFWKATDVNKTTDTVSIIAVGDMMFSREVAKKIKKEGPDYPFKKIHHVLSRGCIRFGNLENPIADKGSPSPFVQSNFRADPIVSNTLASVGFNVLSLANNHIYDYGATAVEETLALLRKEKIALIGVGKSFKEASQPAILTTNPGMKVGFLAYTSTYNTTDSSHKYVASPIDLKKIEKDVTKVKSKADICIVSLHFGYENVEYPPPKCRRQAQKIIEYGANLVIGHHPHVLHGLEQYKDGFIAYSLGNFVFDNLTDRKRESIILEATFDKISLKSIDLLPVLINDDYQPQVASGEIANQIIDRIHILSEYLEDGTSDRRFWEVTGARFLSDQRRSFVRSIKRDGLKAAFVRLRHLRFFHLQLLGVPLLKKAKRLLGKRK